MAILRAGRSAGVLSSVPLQLLLRLTSLYFIVYFLLTLGLLIRKNYLVCDVALLFLLAALEVLHFLCGVKGNLTESESYILANILVTAGTVLLTVYFLVWQTYVMRADVIISGIMLAVYGLDGVLAVSTLARFASSPLWMPEIMSSPRSQSGAANGVARSDSKLSAKALYEQRKKYSNSNFITHETSQYHVEHLSTFMMDKSESIITVDDAIKKLKLLDSKDKIWTQEMLLQVTDKAVKLLDCDTQEELENFPLPTIHMCQTVLNQTRYMSVLLIVCQDKEQHKPDIHFFHCDEVDAELVHADIDSALGDTKHGKNMRPQTLK
ncbi:hypothetical protein OJAV_G00055050 [Oryzias javanicus]|uniref:PID domain-containing protein n=1 Tax=Oryzias javanicus TaxID=123683 RepID=A0A3S2PEP8_ORYJA|nr:hypothetical protein OJAV_G00055050 [Oryzias javanicus]